jgi:hypothetical protein
LIRATIAAMARCAWLAILVLGCGHPAPSPTTTRAAQVAPADAAVIAPRPLDDDLPRLAARSVQMYQDLRGALTEAGGDCAAAATRINALADRNADVIAANGRVLRAGRDKVKQLRAALEPHQAELDDAAQAIAHAPAMASCSGDAAFSRAIDRIGGES